MSVPRTGNVALPLQIDTACSPRGSRCFFDLFEGSLKEGRTPS